MSYTLSLTLGGSLLAVWVDARFPAIRPKTLAQGLTHAVIGAFVVMGAAGFLQVVYGIRQTFFMALVLAVFLPALTYALLTGLWMLRTLANIVALYR